MNRDSVDKGPKFNNRFVYGNVSMRMSIGMTSLSVIIVVLWSLSMWLLVLLAAAAANVTNKKNRMEFSQYARDFLDSDFRVWACTVA